ncbi:MAG: spinster family MFS transporter [Sphingorhabdus sp.]
MTMGKAREISPRVTILLLMVMYACMTIDRSIMSILTEPVRQEFQLNDVELALLSSFAFAVCHGLAAIPFGILADRYNRQHIICACLAVWSLFTSLGGFAQNAIQLTLSRIGVGIVEAGGSPAAVALIADTVRPERRALAMSIFYFGGPIGTILLFAGGGWIANAYGWRAAMIIAGLPGIFLALLIGLLVRDPRNQAVAVKPASLADSGIKETVRYMLATPSLGNVVIGITLCAIVLSAELVWLVSFLMRSHAMTLAQAGGIAAFGYGFASAMGVLGGGLLVDRLSKGRSLAVSSHFLTWSSLLACPLLLGVLLAEAMWLMFVSLALWSILASTWFGPAYGLSQDLARTDQRARVSSVTYLLTGVIGFALGPQIVGIASELARPLVGEESLRLALLLPVLGHLAAAYFFWKSGQTVAADMNALHAQP